MTKPPCARCAATRGPEIAESHTTAQCWGDGYFEARHAHFVRHRTEALEKRKQDTEAAQRQAALRQSIAGPSVQRQFLQVQHTCILDHFATFEHVAATEIIDRAEPAEEEQCRRPMLP